MKGDDTPLGSAQMSQTPVLLIDDCLQPPGNSYSLACPYDARADRLPVFQVPLVDAHVENGRCNREMTNVTQYDPDENPSSRLGLQADMG